MCCQILCTLLYLFVGFDIKYCFHNITIVWLTVKPVKRINLPKWNLADTENNRPLPSAQITPHISKNKGVWPLLSCRFTWYTVCVGMSQFTNTPQQSSSIHILRKIKQRLPEASKMVPHNIADNNLSALQRVVAWQTRKRVMHWNHYGGLTKRGKWCKVGSR